jgi:hypothetical protein
MNRNDFFFKTINIPNYDNILLEIQTYCLANLPEDGSTFSHIPVEPLINSSPYLTAWLASSNLQVRACAVIRFPTSKVAGPHIDSTYNDLALNFPIKNCANCWTAFYKLNKGSFQSRPLPNGLLFNGLSDDAEVIEVSRFSLSTSTLINVKQLHQVWNPTDQLRISASLRFERDPWELI